MNRLQQKYIDTIRPDLSKELGVTNILQLPRLEKIVVNAGVGRAVMDSKNIDPVVATITNITGQKPVVTQSKKSIATFKLREKMPIGVMVTLRGERMYAFLDQLNSVVLPRLRDFRGLNPRSFDKSGNYSIGIADHSVFPEISYEDSGHVHGLQITLVTSTDDVTAARALLLGLGVPLAKEAN